MKNKINSIGKSPLLVSLPFFISTLLPNFAWSHGDGGDEMTEPPSESTPIVASHEGGLSQPSGHHAMTHPFLTHMGLPDGPGEVSIRLTGIERAQRRDGGTDVAFHVEAGIIERLGIHLRNDAIRGAGMDSMDMEDHGTDLMLMYAFLQNAEATRGLSVLAEVGAPTVQRDGDPIRYGVGLAGRWIQSTRVQFDVVSHLSPAENGWEGAYESSLVLRVAGRVFGVLETNGELSSGDPTNYILTAVKVGLGKTGATVGAGVQVATTSARKYARQAMFQMDWGF